MRLFADLYGMASFLFLLVYTKKEKKSTNTLNNLFLNNSLLNQTTLLLTSFVILLSTPDFHFYNELFSFYCFCNSFPCPYICNILKAFFIIMLRKYKGSNYDLITAISYSLIPCPSNCIIWSSSSASKTALCVSLYLLFLLSIFNIFSTPYPYFNLPVL